MIATGNNKNKNILLILLLLISPFILLRLLAAPGLSSRNNLFRTKISDEHVVGIILITDDDVQNEYLEKAEDGGFVEINAEDFDSFYKTVSIPDPQEYGILYFTRQEVYGDGNTRTIIVREKTAEGSRTVFTLYADKPGYIWLMYGRDYIGNECRINYASEYSGKEWKKEFKYNEHGLFRKYTITIETAVVPSQQ